MLLPVLEYLNLPPYMNGEKNIPMTIVKIMPIFKNPMEVA